MGGRSQSKTLGNRIFNPKKLKYKISGNISEYSRKNYCGNRYCFNSAQLARNAYSHGAGDGFRQKRYIPGFIHFEKNTHKKYRNGACHNTRKNRNQNGE